MEEMNVRTKENLLFYASFMRGPARARPTSGNARLSTLPTPRTFPNTGTHDQLSVSLDTYAMQYNVVQ